MHFNIKNHSIVLKVFMQLWAANLSKEHGLFYFFIFTCLPLQQTTKSSSHIWSLHKVCFMLVYWYSFYFMDSNFIFFILASPNLALYIKIHITMHETRKEVVKWDDRWILFFYESFETNKKGSEENTHKNSTQKCIPLFHLILFLYKN